MQNRAEAIDQQFIRALNDQQFPESSTHISLSQLGMSAEQLIALFKTQMISRQLDFTSRILQAKGESFYTIGSAGHEGNAAIAEAFRLDDIAFLHYRDAAFLLQRAKQHTDDERIRDMMLSFVASRDDPISGGRHKVLGSHDLFIPPQTSTIASHLPKAVGTAFSIPLAKKMKHSHARLSTDSVVLCSFGDASANHSTAQGAFNAAAWAAYQNLPLPLVFICEDNDMGISTPTPAGWIATKFRQYPGLHYLYCDGLNLLDTYRAAKEAEHIARKLHQPVFLHMHCVRLMGHAGSDAQSAYLSQQQIEAVEAQDPLLHSARILIELKLMRADQILNLYQEMAERSLKIGLECSQHPKLNTADEVKASLIPPKRTLPAIQPVSFDTRATLFQPELKAMNEPQHMAKLLNWALADLMLAQSEIVMAGEDIAAKGGVYNVTSRLSDKFGTHRVINTLLDEQSILGLAIGLAHNGFLPIAEIQFLAYLHNAEDQIRGEAATLSFFSKGQFTNPMIVRIAGLGYQKGFGGHFHNDNSLAVLRDIPGVIIACPSNGEDAVAMIRESARLAIEEQRVIIFLEPIALYMTRDLHESGDGLWRHHYASPDQGKPIHLGELGQYGEGTDLAIVSYGNGYYLSRQAAKVLSEQHGIRLRVIDLRWLAPLNMDGLFSAVSPCQKILIVDECRRTGSQSESIMSELLEEGIEGHRLSRLTAEDCFIPLGKAATLTLPSKESIIHKVLNLN
jgi:2-oxoisovalerate dehydrogenase E1 component